MFSLSAIYIKLFGITSTRAIFPCPFFVFFHRFFFVTSLLFSFGTLHILQYSFGIFYLQVKKLSVLNNSKMYVITWAQRSINIALLFSDDVFLSTPLPSKL